MNQTVAGYLAEGASSLDDAVKRGIFDPVAMAGDLASLDVLVEQLDIAVSRDEKGRPPRKPSWADDPRFAYIRRDLDEGVLGLVDAAAFQVGEVLVAVGAGARLRWEEGRDDGEHRGRVVVVDQRGAELDPLFHTYLALYRRRSGDRHAPTLSEDLRSVLDQASRSEQDHLRAALATYTPRKRYVVQHRPAGLRRRRPPLDRAALQEGLASLTGRPVELENQPSPWVGQVEGDLHESVLLAVEPLENEPAQPLALVVSVMWGGDEPRRGGQREALEVVLGQVRALAERLGAQMEDHSPPKGEDASW